MNKDIRLRVRHVGYRHTLVKDTGQEITEIHDQLSRQGLAQGELSNTPGAVLIVEPEIEGLLGEDHLPGEREFQEQAVYGFRRRRPWMAFWAPAYTAQVAFGIYLWTAIETGGFTG